MPLEIPLLNTPSCQIASRRIRTNPLLRKNKEFSQRYPFRITLRLLKKVVFLFIYLFGHNGFLQLTACATFF